MTQRLFGEEPHPSPTDRAPTRRARSNFFLGWMRAALCVGLSALMVIGTPVASASSIHPDPAPQPPYFPHVNGGANGAGWHHEVLDWINPNGSLIDDRVLFGLTPSLGSIDDLHAIASTADMSANVTPGIGYFFEVEAENSTGWSLPSTKIESAEPGYPPHATPVSAPAIVSAKWMQTPTLGLVNLTVSYTNGTSPESGFAVVAYNNSSTTNPNLLYSEPTVPSTVLKIPGFTPTRFSFIVNLNGFYGWKISVQAWNQTAQLGGTFLMVTNFSLPAFVNISNQLNGGNGSNGTTVINEFFTTNGATAGSLIALFLAIIVGIIIVWLAGQKKRKTRKT